MRTTFAALAVSFLLATGAQAGVTTVLTPDSTLYSIEANPETQALELTRRVGDERQLLVVPTTGDDAIESEPRLAYDRCTNRLYVLWHRAEEETDEVRMAALDAEGNWSSALLIASGAEARRGGLQLVLTHAPGEKHTTLLHAAWWSVGVDVVPEYAIVAFANGEHLSTSVANLEELAGIREAEERTEVEDTGDAPHPPLSVEKADERYVDVVFGRDRSTTITRVRVEPRRVAGNARMWRPSGRTGERTGPARLIAANAQAVQAFISNNRVVLYTPDSQFRFSVYANGRWSPIRMIALDEKLSSEQVLQELRATVVEHELNTETEQPDSE